MRSMLNGIPVNDQERAMRFYTEVLGFQLKHDIPMGAFRWLTVVAVDGRGAEVALEPDANPASKAFQESLWSQGIPVTAFEVDDVDAEHARLVDAGVTFKTPPTDGGPTRIAVLDDTCGNWIQLYQPPQD